MTTTRNALGWGLLGLDREEVRKRAAWEAAHPVTGGLLSGGEFRNDDFGHLMRWSDYGTCESFGWEIDHRLPTALGGSDELSNLRAVNSRHNRRMGGLLGNALADWRPMTGE